MKCLLASTSSGLIFLSSDGAGKSLQLADAIPDGNNYCFINLKLWPLRLIK